MLGYTLSRINSLSQVINAESLMWLIIALGYKWNHQWQGICNYLRAQIIRVISHKQVA